MYIPAETRVAEWIKAEAGIGASIESGNHKCKPKCADLTNEALIKPIKAQICQDNRLVDFWRELFKTSQKSPLKTKESLFKYKIIQIKTKTPLSLNLLKHKTLFEANWDLALKL